MKRLDEDFESSMIIMTLPVYLRWYFRTSNHIERLNKELKRRSKVIGVCPNDASLMCLIGIVLVERNEALMLRRRIFKEETYKQMMTPEVTLQLIAIAQEQHQLLAA